MEEFDNNKAVWVDEDDENLKINLNKKNRLKKLKKGEESLITGIIHPFYLQVPNFKIDLEINITKSIPKLISITGLSKKKKKKMNLMTKADLMVYSKLIRISLHLM